MERFCRCNFKEIKKIKNFKNLCLYGSYFYICGVYIGKMDLKELKRIRKVEKITIRQLSKKTGINEDRISLIERGVVNPSFQTVETIASGINAEIILRHGKDL